MDWQLALTCLTFAIAAFYLVQRLWQTWRGLNGGCGGSCGCAKAKPTEIKPALIAPEQLQLRQHSARHSD